MSRIRPANAVEIDSTRPAGRWIGSDGRAKHRWDAISKVTGEKVFARDFRARDLPGWPDAQTHAFFIKATRADAVFEGVDLSVLGPDLQPSRVVLHEDLERDRVLVPQEVMGHGFYGYDFLTPRGRTPRMLGHPVALLIYDDFDRFEAAKRLLRFNNEVVRYGAETGPEPPPNYGVDRWIRLGSKDPFAEPVFSGMKDGPIRGKFDGNTPVWPPALTDPVTPPLNRLRERGAPLARPPRSEDETRLHEERGMEIAAQIAAEIEAAKSDPSRLVLSRHGFSQSIDPCAMEPDNGNAWYDAETRTLHLLAATQSPYGVARAAAEIVKGCAFPVDHIELLTGTTVGYGSKDYSIFPLYTVMAAFYGGGKPVRLANDRYEQFQMGMKRHSFDIDISLVVDRATGTFEILKGDYVCNGGGRANLSVAVSHEAVRGAQSMYYFPKSDLSAVALSSRAVEAGSMRGFGALQAQTILEIMVDEVAGELDIDPIELRRRNALREGYANTQGGPQGGALRNLEMLDRAAAHPLWKDRASAKAAYESANPGRLYGVGYAQVNKVFGAGGDVSALSLEFDATGKLTLRHCCQEIGTGATTAQQVMIWQAIGKAPDEVTFGVTDFPELPLTTSGSADDGVKNPFWTPSYLPDMSSSASVYYIGMATRTAGRFLFENTIWPAARSIWSAVSLPAAIAMQPPAPTRYRSFLGSAGAHLKFFSQLTIMALRHLFRWPLRTAFTILSTSLSVSILVAALFTFDSIDFMMDTIFIRAERQDATVTFAKEAPPAAVLSAARLPGVLHAEPFRAAAVILRNGHRERRVSITGLTPDARLMRILDEDQNVVPLSPEGLVVSDRVAKLLHLEMGDLVEVELI